MAFSNYLLTQLCQMVFGNAGFVPPAVIYVGVSTTQPNADGTNVSEPVGNGYARVAITNDSSHWHAAPFQPSTGDRQSNILTITFPQATADWGVVAYAVLYDAPSGGNFLGWGALATPQDVTAGTTVAFSPDQLTATMQ